MAEWDWGYLAGLGISFVLPAAILLSIVVKEVQEARRDRAQATEQGNTQSR